MSLGLPEFWRSPREIQLSFRPGTWHLVLHSADAIWGGPGQAVPEFIPRDCSQTVTQQTLKLAPHSVLVYSTTHENNCSEGKIAPMI
ncbi:MAG: hypothetical protein HC857_04925 [Synechococcales cyanobacterium RU_4_20]|nr:hypothetical protein [Synechococcales cyanobacterium RU_4_20]